MPDDFLSQEEIDALLGKKDEDETDPSPEDEANQEDENQQELPSNIGLILDFTLNVSVRLGEITKSLRELRQLTPGNVIELNHYINNPVDIYVNGKLIAKGEVIVIDENYAVKVSHIIEPVDRIRRLR